MSPFSLIVTTSPLSTTHNRHSKLGTAPATTPTRKKNNPLFNFKTEDKIALFCSLLLFRYIFVCSFAVAPNNNNHYCILYASICCYSISDPIEMKGKFFSFCFSISENFVAICFVSHACKKERQTNRTMTLTTTTAAWTTREKKHNVTHAH